MASIVKVDTLATLLHQKKQQGNTRLSGSERSLATSMMQTSDNDAATQLWDQVGGPDGVATFNAKVPGMSATTPNKAWGMSKTSAADQNALLNVFVHPNRLLTTAQRHEALGLMEHVTPSQAWGVSAGVPHGVTVALKNGWLPRPHGWQVNSIGIISGNGRHYLVSVLTARNPSEQYGIDTIEGVSRRVWHGLAHRTTKVRR